MDSGKNSPLDWWRLSEMQVAHYLNTDSNLGLSSNEARKRYDAFGSNELLEKKKKSAISIFLHQFTSLIIWVLVGAAIISGFLHDWINAFAIIAIVIINSILGFFQEYKAERSLAALRQIVTPTSKVVRDGKLQTIPSKKIVPGDLLLIEAGDRIPADGRFNEVFNLVVQEASLTGESLPVHKIDHIINEVNLPIGDRSNMGFMGTVALKGKGWMIVTSTGLRTELGKIAENLQEEDDELTPLQKRLNTLGFRLVCACLIIVFAIFVVGLLKGTSLKENLLISISLAVAAIPEGLPAIVTIALSIGVLVMSRRNALIRHLPSVETLGCTTVICTDKTGTLTKSEMFVEVIYAGTKMVKVTGEGYRPEGSFVIDGKQIEPKQYPDLLKALEIGVLCNSSELNKVSGEWEFAGDPTEIAMLTAAAKAGLYKVELENENPIISEIPFDSERKRMSIARNTQDGPTLFIKGAFDVLLNCSHSILINGKIHTLTAEIRRELESVNQHLAIQAYRILAVGYRSLTKEMEIEPSIEQDIIFVGLMAMLDPPRIEVKRAIEMCKNAGVKTVMITGDHRETASAVAKKLNMLTDESIIMTGKELDQIDDEQLRDKIRNIVVYSRTSSTHKPRIVKAWKSFGETVAMTGDGVNDAPALKASDIGIAMGITGTDVTKEVADLIIADDNFATIVYAIEEGRAIYDNIVKFVSYLFSSNVSEIMIVFSGLLMGFTDPAGNHFFPLTAVQILWINLASDGFPALALVFDPSDPQAMSRPPRKPNEQIIDREKAFYLFSISAIVSVGTLLACFIGSYESAITAQTMSFTTLVLLELAIVQIIRAKYNMKFLSNKYLLASLALSFTLQQMIIYIPFLQRIFHTAPLGLKQWGIIFGITGMVYLLCCLVNYIFNPRRTS